MQRGLDKAPGNCLIIYILSDRDTELYALTEFLTADPKVRCTRIEVRTVRSCKDWVSMPGFCRKSGISGKGASEDVVT